MNEFITQFAATEQHAEEAQGIAALGLDPWAILIQGLTFLVFLLLIKKFALGKIVSVLETRRKTVEKSLDQAEELKKQSEAGEARINQQLKEARVEAEKILQKSHEEAGAIVQQAEDAATKKTEKIIENGKKQIESEVVKAKQALKAETLELVGYASTAVLGESVDARKHEKLVENALLEVEK